MCDGGSIKYDSENSCVCDTGHTVGAYELFAIRQDNTNGSQNTYVCEVRHIVHSDKLFALIELEHKRVTITRCV